MQSNEDCSDGSPLRSAAALSQHCGLTCATSARGHKRRSRVQERYRNRSPAHPSPTDMLRRRRPIGALCRFCCKSRSAPRFTCGLASRVESWFRLASFEESHSGIRHHEKLRFRRSLSVSSSEAQLGLLQHNLPITAVSRCNKVSVQPYSITSSARASKAGGMVRPSAFAVLRLIAKSNLVGCSTGRSAGLAPRNILSMYWVPRLRLRRISWA